MSSRASRRAIKGAAVSGVEEAGLGSTESNPNHEERQLDFHPGIPMRWEITRTTTDTNGELFEAINWLDAHSATRPVGPSFALPWICIRVLLGREPSQTHSLGRGPDASSTVHNVCRHVS